MGRLAGWIPVIRLLVPAVGGPWSGPATSTRLVEWLSVWAAC